MCFCSRCPSLPVPVSLGSRVSSQPLDSVSVSMCAPRCLSFLSVSLSMSLYLPLFSVSRSAHPRSSPASGPHLLVTAASRQGAAQTGPALLWPCGAGLGSGLQAPSVPPLVLVPLLRSSQPPRVFVFLVVTRPLCLSLAAPAPPHPHLPLHIPRTDRGSW